MIASRVLTVLLLLMLPFSVAAQEALYKAGTHYEVLDTPQKTRNKDKVEVLEFFSYTCGHCFTFEPHVKKWKQSKAEDVDFWRSHVVWGKPMEGLARAYATAQSLRVLEKAHAALFNAVHVERKRLNSEDDLAAVFASIGVDKEKFRKAYNSFSATSGVRLANARARNFKVASTPQLVVAGKYRITAGGAVRSQKQMLEIADYLVAQERAKR